MTELYSLELIANILERTHQEPDITDMPPDLREHRAGWFRNAAAALRKAEAELATMTAERDALKEQIRERNIFEGGI